MQLHFDDRWQINTIQYNTIEPFHDGGRYHIETSLLICTANLWTGVYMITF